MMGKEIVATRSSPRLKNKVRQINVSSHKNLPDKDTVDASIIREEASSPSSSTAAYNVYLPQSLLAEEKPDRELAVHPALLRTTTHNNRRGGRAAGSVSKQSYRVDLKPRESEDQRELSDADSYKELEKKMKDFDNHASISVHTPSTAAAAAAAAAKALCDHTTRGRYDLGLPRSYFEERQNVFRAREDDSHSRITTKTRSDGAIRKAGMSFGNSTVRVMGSPTPTHISTRPYGSSTNEQRPVVTDHRYKSPSKSQSVFRNPQPCADGTRQLQSADVSPQQLLMSLKSGSRSFELKSPVRNYAGVHRNHDQSDDGNRSSQSHVPLSPDASPDLHGPHHQSSRTEYFFHPRTPKTPKTPNIDFARNDNFHGTPSFSLFNQSFDSLVDASYLRSPNDQPLAVNFSLMDATPQKKSFMASPGTNFHGFSFSPTKQHTDELEDFVEGSPGITLDNCMVDALDDAPLLPRTTKTSPNAFCGSDVMILESSKLVRDVPTPTASNQSPRVKSPKDVPLKKRHNMVSLDHRSDNFVQKTPSSGPFESDKRVMEGRSVVRPGTSIQEHFRPADRPSHPEHAQHTSVPPQQAYGQTILPPPHIYRSGFHPNFYQSKRKTTTLVGLTLDQIHERFASHKKAFSKCCYLLPGFQAMVEESKVGRCSEEIRSMSNDVVKTVSPDRNDSNKAESEVKGTEHSVIASRRVDSAICAFGGQVIKKDKATESKTYYSNAITNRYFEHESRISWDVEESPPVESPRKLSNKTQTGTPVKRVGDDTDMNPKTPKTSKMYDSSDSPESALKTADEEGSDSARGDAPRMKYRCKLCGKPKQNHKCPYQKSLQRSIGISVYPAINAFAASEPGNLAPALSEMNNFVREDSIPEITPSRPKRVEASIFRGQHPIAYKSAPHVTPENMRSMKSPSPYIYQESYSCSTHMVLSPMRNIRRRHILSPEKNSTRSQLCRLSDLVFIESTPLREEQFRTVFSSKNLGNFEYPCIPLPYSQRKTLSDNLFELSKELPTLKEDCAIVLRQAREDDMWDVAVAELLTQVIVAIHCPPEDTRLEGLSRFLNSLGFAC